jgi:hypothetical protein
MSCDYDVPKHIYIHELDRLCGIPPIKIINGLPEEQIVTMCNVKDLDELWKKSRIEPYGLNLNGRAYNKYVNSRIDLFTNKSIEPPQFSIDDGTFINGRNRFANLRDLGLVEIPCVFEK